MVLPDEVDLRCDPGRRRRLLELLTVLRDTGRIEWSAARDRTVRPELHSFVNVGVTAPSEPASLSSQPRLAWRPELEWAYGLRLTPAEHEILTITNTYRRDRDPASEAIPHRERSLLLLGDEKRIDRLVRSRLFEPDRLALGLLDDYWAAPPIAVKIVGETGGCVVSENAASFHTLHHSLKGTVRAVAYGGGSAFVQSIVGLDLVAGERLLYIGDLDAEGVAIPQRAAVTAERFNMPLPEPYTELWRLLVELAGDHGQTASPVPTEVAAELCTWFGDAELATAVQQLLENGVRVPQEALTGDRLRQR